MRKLFAIPVAMLIGVLAFFGIGVPSAESATSHKCAKFERPLLNDGIFCMNTGATTQAGGWEDGYRVNWITVYTDGTGPNFCNDDSFENSPAIETLDLKIINDNGNTVHTLLGPDVTSGNNCSYTWNFTGQGQGCDCIKVATKWGFDIRYHFKAHVNNASDETGFLNERWNPADF